MPWARKRYPACGALVSAILREQFFRRLFEYPDELVADHLAFRLRVGHALERSEKMLGGVDILEFDLEILAEDALHDLRFVFAQQPVVNENTGELVADCLVQKRCRDRGIDAAAQTKHDLFVADLLRARDRRLRR